MNKRIGIFGGSFNPVHNGHRLMVKAFLDSRVTGEVWILPAPDPPHKTGGLLAPFHHRFEMLNLAFDGVDNVHIKDVEEHLSKPSYTLQTILYLEKKYPKTLFFLCMGEDSLAGFDSWYRHEEILDRVSLVVARRRGCEGSSPGMTILRHTLLLDNPFVEISSGYIRNFGIEAGHLPEKVENYIHEHDLYSPAKSGSQ